MKRTNSCLFVVLLSGLCLPMSSAARQYSLDGSVGLDNDYRSNVFHTDSGHIDEWNTEISPMLTLDSVGQNDSVSITYAPTFSYNHRRDERELSYGGLGLVAEKALSSQWKLNLSNSYDYHDNPVFEANTSLSLGQQFLRADSATQGEIVRLLFPEMTAWDGSQLTQVLAVINSRYTGAGTSVQAEVDGLLDPAGTGETRRRYWDNSLSLVSEYEFAQNSTISFGYSFEVHDEKTGVQADSVSHMPNLLLAYEISPQWSVQAGYGYDYTNYDTSDDSKSDSIDLSLAFFPKPSTSMRASYAYEDIDFEGTSDDSTTHNTSLGLSHEFDQQTSIDGDLGYSYQARERAADEREYSFSSVLSRAIPKGSVSATIGANLGETSTAGSWGKLDNSWNLGGNLQYDCSQDVSTTLDFSYEQRNSWTNNQKTTYDDYAVGAGVSYPFMRWFVFSVDYDYHLFNTTGASLDDYDEHRVNIRLSASKELLRW